jgi:hypothetical protein
MSSTGTAPSRTALTTAAFRLTVQFCLGDGKPFLTVAPLLLCGAREGLDSLPFRDALCGIEQIRGKFSRNAAFHPVQRRTKLRMT